jgi:hypothetical protein
MRPCSTAAARRGKGRKSLPAVVPRIVDFVDIEVARVVPVDAAADGIEHSVHGGDGEMIARRRNWRQRSPLFGVGIIDLVRTRVAIAPVVATHRMNFAVGHGRRRERR